MMPSACSALISSMVLFTNPLSTKLPKRQSRQDKRRARPASRTAALVNTTPRLCGAAGALYFLAFERFLAAHIDFNLLRLGFGFLCKLDLQDSLVIVCLNVLGINRVRKRERTSEAA